MSSRARATAALLVFAGVSFGTPLAAAHAVEPVVVTPGVPVVSDAECGVGQDTITIPETEGVTYSLSFDDVTAILPQGVEIPGALALFGDGSEFAFQYGIKQAEMTLDITADEGYVLDDQAADTVDVVVDTTACASVDSSPLQVSSTTCEQLTVTNPASNPEAYLLVEDTTSYEPYGSIVPAGATATVDVPAGTYHWEGFTSDIVGEFSTKADARSGDTSAARRSAAKALADDPTTAVPDQLPSLRGAQKAPADEVFELTEADLDALRETGLDFDEITTGAFELGAGRIVVASCDDESPTPGSPAAPVADPTDVDDAPQVPAVVQTDGGSPGHGPIGAAVLAGISALAAAALTRRAARR